MTVTIHVANLFTPLNMNNTLSPLSPYTTPQLYSTTFVLNYKLTFTMDSIDPKQARDHVLRLSAIDQIQPRGYIRVILCFPLHPNSSTSHISQTLQVALHTTIIRWPIFGGTVALPKSDTQSGRLGLRYSSPPNHVSLEVKELGPDEFQYTYEELDDKGMPLLPLNEVLLC